MKSKTTFSNHRNRIARHKRRNRTPRNGMQHTNIHRSTKWFQFKRKHHGNGRIREWLERRQNAVREKNLSELAIRLRTVLLSVCLVFFSFFLFGHVTALVLCFIIPIFGAYGIKKNNPIFMGFADLNPLQFIAGLCLSIIIFSNNWSNTLFPILIIGLVLEAILVEYLKAQTPESLREEKKLRQAQRKNKLG